jgi:hypothetical protein
MPETSPPTRTGVPRRKTEPELPVLAAIMNNIIELDLNYYFHKRYDDIVKATSDLPVVIEYINESLQRASIEAMNAKWDVEAMEGETYMRLRQEWTSHYSEKMTEDALGHAVSMDEDLKKARNNYAVLKSYVGRLHNMQENLRSKLDALRSVEATRRKLIEDDPEDNT